MIKSPVYEIEDLCGEVSKDLSTGTNMPSCRGQDEAEYVVKRETPVSKINCQEVVNIFAEARAIRGHELTVRKMIGAEVLGITACPAPRK